MSDEAIPDGLLIHDRGLDVVRIRRADLGGDWKLVAGLPFAETVDLDDFDVPTIVSPVSE